MPKQLLEDNLKCWSGAHVINPELVPGILFTSRPICAQHPSLYDLAPTILKLMGFDECRLQVEDIDGRPLF